MDDLQMLQNALATQSDAPIDLITFDDNKDIYGIGRGDGKFFLIAQPQLSKSEFSSLVGKIASRLDDGRGIKGTKFEIVTFTLSADDSGVEKMKAILGALRSTQKDPIGITEDEAKRAYDFFELGPKQDDPDKIRKRIL